MSLIRQFIYALPFHTTVTLLGLLYIAWHAIHQKVLEKKWYAFWKWLCFMLFISWTVVVLCITVFSRSTGTQELYRMPFHQLKQLLNGGTTELLRSAWMNVLLFVPGGLLICSLLPEKWSIMARCGISAVLLIIFSVGIELIQWHCQLGVAESDDVICNLLGTAIGLGIAEKVK